MLNKLWAIIANSYTETVRQPIYGIILLATAGLLVLNVSLAAYTLEDDNKFLKDMGLSTLLVSGLFLSAFSAAGVLSREIENKTVLTVISKPIGRPLFLLGKFLGLGGALATGFYLVGIVFLLCMRHRVMSTASDHIDMPVMLFGVGAVLGSVLIAAFCNFLYDMQFTSTAMRLVVPLMTVAILLVAMINDEWEIQQFGKDFIDGQLIGALLLVFAMVMILTAVAVAVSTRLGQVMTLSICTGVLMIGLVSDAWFGQYRDAHFLGQLAYWVSPNLAFLWITDALTRGDHVSVKYVLTSFTYAGLLSLSWLLIGVALFQKREVG